MKHLTNNSNDLGLKLNSLIKEEDIYTEVECNNFINQELQKLNKKRNNQMIKEQKVKQNRFFDIQYAEIHDKEVLDTYNANNENAVNSNSNINSNLSTSNNTNSLNANHNVKRKKNFNNHFKLKPFDYLQNKLYTSLLDKTPKHLSEYQKGKDHNDKIFINLNTFQNNIEDERKLLKKSYQLNKIKNVYQFGLEKYKNKIGMNAYTSTDFKNDSNPSVYCYYKNNNYHSMGKNIGSDINKSKINNKHIIEADNKYQNNGNNNQSNFNTINSKNNTENLLNKHQYNSNLSSLFNKVGIDSNVTSIQGSNMNVVIKSKGVYNDYKNKYNEQSNDVSSNMIDNIERESEIIKTENS